MLFVDIVVAKQNWEKLSLVDGKISMEITPTFSFFLNHLWHAKKSMMVARVTCSGATLF